MSGMFEQKSDKATRKLERTQKEEQARKKSRIRIIVIISVLLVVTTLAILVNSNFIRRTLPVITIDSVSFSTTEFEYFFNSEYFEYTNFMSQFQGFGAVPDTNRPLASQIQDFATGATWADFFYDSTISRMGTLATLYTAAKEAGFELTQQQLDEIDDELEMYGFQAMFSGFPNLDSLLQHLYGSSMNQRTFRSILEFVTLAGAYNEHVRESFTFSEDELIGHYNENRDELDVINYRQFIVYVDFEALEGIEDDEEFEEAIYEAAIATRTEAESIAAGITNEDDFITAARNYSEINSDPDSTLRMNQAGRLDADIGPWLLHESRRAGDFIVIDTEQGSSINLFISRDDNSYPTVGMRQLLFLREQVQAADFPAGENDPAYIAALEHADNELRERAEYVHSLFIAAGGTEDALISLIDEHSDDNTEGGYYSDIAKFPYQSGYLNVMKVVPEIEDWLFAPGRNIGDSELVYTSDFGYHLLYFTGFGRQLNEMIAEDRLRTQEHNAWMSTQTHSHPVRHFAFILVHM